MTRVLQIEVEEVRRVFDLLGKLNGLFHQPLTYRDPEAVKAFADEFYPEIKDLYYKIVWNWLPADIQREIEDR